MLVISFFEWLNLDRFQWKYKSVWILFMKSSLLSVRCECTHFTNLSDLAALSAKSTLFFVVFRTAVSFASLSFMLMIADCFWTWIDVALFAESTLFFVVFRTAVSFALNWSRWVEYLSLSWVLDLKSVELNWNFLKKVLSRVEKLNSRTQIELRSLTWQFDLKTQFNSTRY